MRESHHPERAQTRLFDIESPLAIELRRIMIRLSRLLDLERPRCLMVTSAQRGEGKSLFASHFALVLAHHLRKRILLVDGDLRRPVQHTVYQVPRAPGLAELLRGTAVAAHPTALANLEVMPAGSGRDQTSQILAPERIRDAVAGWRQAYDLVILDSPPVVPVSDPLQYVDAVDGVLYICMAGRTPRDVVVRGVDILRSVGANILGVVANNLSEVLPYYYDRKYYGYEERKAARLAAGTAGYAASGQAGHAGTGAEPGAPAAPASGVDAAGPAADEGSPASGPPGPAE